MRIIRGRDYYDNALAFGRDESIVFVRERDRVLADSEIIGFNGLLEPSILFKEVGHRPIPQPYHYDNEYVFGDLRFRCGHVVVIFCGKIYNGVCIETHGKPVYFWHKERFEDWMAGCGVEMYNSYWRPIDWHAFFTAREASKTLLNWLMTQRVVVAIRFPTTRQTRATSPLRWSINSDRLKEVQFYRVFDAFAAFQEIAMWIGGVLPSNGNAMVAISDTIRLEKHGFSKRSSFRNMER